jgi:serine/threonine protein kinase
MNPHQLSSGHLLYNRYSIQKTLGQGGFGITYLAYDQKLEQEVCIKELFISGNSTRGANMTVQSQGNSSFSFQEFIDRFLQEARQLARFQHPNIVRVIDIFQENNTAYTVMEFVNGETLKERIQRTGALEEKEAMLLINQLLDAVEAVHAKGMLHRDIKPENILISPEGRVVLIDFGSAREFAEGKTTHQTAMITPGYAPPEQYSERAKRGPFTDIYALGATLYFLLTGEKPIASTDRSFEELPAPHQLNPKVSSQVSSAVLLAMEMKPEHRFQDIEEMKGAMNSLLNSSTKKSTNSKKQVISPNKEDRPITNPSAQQSQNKPSSNKSKTGLIVGLLLFAFLILGSSILAAVVIFDVFEEDSNYYPMESSSSSSEIEAAAAAADTAAASPTSSVPTSDFTWPCGDGNFINPAWTNDGECDCNDCSDEDNLFKCTNGEIINVAWLNDGACDCNDCSDEDNLFMCANGTIINAAYLNDGDCDCGASCDDES